MRNSLNHPQKMNLDLRLCVGKMIPQPLENISLPAALRCKMEVPCLRLRLCLGQSHP
uniref:Alternative protein HEG1 n=1 Tax=Homo sapiens TaxID=9606 RepID=L8ECI8_HUMAN|nr:alternative protein HEG1 [Homo sapiens]